jgi:hypothetical protein
VETGRRKSRIFRGGVLDYRQVKKDLTMWMEEDSNEDSFFTTMLDLYRLPADFPEREKTRGQQPRDRVRSLEEAFGCDIGRQRFVPYIQLHEFEALILSDVRPFGEVFLGREKALQALEDLVNRYDSPELIDDGAETSPSKRIIEVLPEYEGRKVSAGPLIAGKISLETIRDKCPHFDEWLKTLENLPQKETT